MISLATKARTALALGLPNIARMISYRLGVKFGLSSVRRLHAILPMGPFFKSFHGKSTVEAPAVSTWSKSGLLFSHWPLALGDEPPNWLSNPFTGERVAAADRCWWEIPDFDPAVGDIKLLWELSRMDWVLAFAQRIRQGDSESLVRVNTWINDWGKHNPPYRGPNWKCGQEASIRVMHLAMAAHILGQAKEATPGLRDLVHLHLRRIAPTIQYAVAQDNNHGTSEAAALFIGGSWLALFGCADGKRWALSGRRWLENRAARLIGVNGTFSQYSLNYHRVMLDTFCMVEVWRRHLDLPPFTERLQSRIFSATEWLRHMVNPIDGDGPNVGANDGARLLQLTNTRYRDHRPTVQLAMALFAMKRAYSQHGPWDAAFQWLNIDLPQEIAPAPKSYLADDGGFAILRDGDVMALMRYPRFNFRPSQADALHLDFWLGADNLLRDAGTYSYNTDHQWLNYFGGTISHNTVEFDGRDQMPRLGRFLLGDWLKTERLEPLHEDIKGLHFAAGYRRAKGPSHYRSLILEDNILQITDTVKEFTHKAVLRWRLLPGNWEVKQSPLGPRLKLNADRIFTLSVSADAPITRCEIVQGWESHYYLEKTAVPVLEVEIQKPGTLITELSWTT